MATKANKYNKHINYVVECAVCNKQFGATRRTAKYCSNECRQRAYYVRLGIGGMLVPQKVSVPTEVDDWLRANQISRPTMSKPAKPATAKPAKWAQSWLMCHESIVDLRKSATLLCSRISMPIDLSKLGKGGVKECANSKVRVSLIKTDAKTRQMMRSQISNDYYAVSHVVRIDVASKVINPISAEDITAYVFKLPVVELLSAGK